MRTHTGRNPPSDDELLQIARRGADSESVRAAASELLARYRRRIYAWCYQVVQDPESAADLAQDVLIAAYRGLPAFEGKARFSSWLFAITRNRCRSALRRSPAQLGIELVSSGDVDVADCADADANPARRIAEREFWELVGRKLDPVEQEAIWLRYFEGMSVVMITSILNLSGRTGARAVLQRARRKLKVVLRQRWEND